MVLLEQAEKFYNSRHSKMEAALHRLEKKRDEFLQNQQWKHYGDLILTYGHLIDGSQDYLECEDYESGALIRIKIHKFGANAINGKITAFMNVARNNIIFLP